ncbi:unnamed protein product [Ectocarpus sp. 4 AP-2014]
MKTAGAIALVTLGCANAFVMPAGHTGVRAETARAAEKINTIEFELDKPKASCNDGLRGRREQEGVLSVRTSGDSSSVLQVCSGKCTHRSPCPLLLLIVYVCVFQRVLNHFLYPGA